MLDVKINFELDDLTKDLQSVASEIVWTAGNELLDKWKDEARSGLNRSRAKYMSGLGIEAAEAGPDEAAVDVFLKGELPVAIEEGSRAYDIKKGFDDRKVIPLEIGVGATELPGIDTGQELRTFFKRSESLVQRKTIRREFFGKPDYQANVRIKRKLFEGAERITRDRPSFNPASTHVVFRTINKSDPQSFIHPGFTPRNYADKALGNWMWIPLLTEL